jgi:hypothetical protein
VPPGPVVGRAWKHLKEVRLEQGPLTREAAEAELRSWWATQPHPPSTTSAQPPLPGTRRQPVIPWSRAQRSNSASASSRSIGPRSRRNSFRWRQA